MTFSSVSECSVVVIVSGLLLVGLPQVCSTPAPVVRVDEEGKADALLKRSWIGDAATTGISRPGTWGMVLGIRSALLRVSCRLPKSRSLLTLLDATMRRSLEVKVKSPRARVNNMRRAGPASTLLNSSSSSPSVHHFLLSAL
jgi:hypothetical protein